MSSVWSRIVFFSLCYLCNLTLLSAQAIGVDSNPKNNSPYSRFGLGDPVPQYFAAAGGMGGLSAAFNDPYHLNILNPASLPFLESTAFEVGLYSRYAQLQDQNTTDDIWSGNLNYIALGFPLRNKINEALDRQDYTWEFGMSLALLPTTLVGYDIQTTTPREELGSTTTRLKGSGGTTRVVWGSGAKYRNFSAGFTLGYQFGKINRSREVAFDSLRFSYTTDFFDDISFSGLVWSAGVQYIFDFMELDDNGKKVPSGKRLILGAFGNKDNQINTNSSSFYRRTNTT